MTVVERIRRFNAEHEMSCAELDIDDDGLQLSSPACFWIDDLPYMTPRRAKIAWSQGRCPLCFWTLVRSFGLTMEETTL